MRHKSVHQYFKYVISVKIFGPTSTRGSVCSQSIYSIYIYLSIFRFIINRSQKSTGIPQCWVFNIILKVWWGWKRYQHITAFFGQFRPHRQTWTMNQASFYFPILAKEKKSTIGCITQTTLHVIYNVIMRSMETVFFGFSLDPPVQRSFERCHAPNSNLQCLFINF